MSEGIKSYPGLYQHVLSEALRTLPAAFKHRAFEDGIVGEAALHLSIAYMHGRELQRWLQRWFKKVLQRFDTGDGKRLAYSAMKAALKPRYSLLLADDGHGELEELLILKYVAIYVNLRKSELKVIDADSTRKGVIKAIIWRLLNNPPVITNPREVTEG